MKTTNFPTPLSVSVQFGHSRIPILAVLIFLELQAGKLRTCDRHLFVCIPHPPLQRGFLCWLRYGILCEALSRFGSELRAVFFLSAMVVMYSPG